jgi:hypothetical protein
MAGDILDEMVAKFNYMSLSLLTMLRDMVTAAAAEDERAIAAMEAEAPQKMQEAARAFAKTRPDHEPRDSDAYLEAREAYMNEALGGDRRRFDTLLARAEKKHAFLTWIGENVEDLQVASDTPSAATLPIQDFLAKLRSQPLPEGASPFDAVLNLLIDESQLPDDLADLQPDEQQIEVSLAMQRSLAEGRVKTDVADVGPLLALAETVLGDFDFLPLYRRCLKPQRRGIVITLCQMTTMAKTWEDAGGSAEMKAGLGRLVSALRSKFT